MATASLLSASTQVTAVTRESLAAHISARIAECSGPQLPCYATDDILNGFFDRFGADDAMAICDLAFGKYNGSWQGAPVTVLRFQEISDDYFSRPLLEEARAGQ